MKRTDDSAIVPIITEIEANIQEVLKQLEELRSDPPILKTAGDALDWEREVQGLTDRLRGLITARAIQRQIDHPTFKEKARKLAQSGPKKMRDQGLRPVTLRLTGGQEVVIKASYFSRNESTARRAAGPVLPGHQIILDVLLQFDVQGQIHIPSKFLRLSAHPTPVNVVDELPPASP